MNTSDERRLALEEDAFGPGASEERRRAAVDELRRLDGRPASDASVAGSDAPIAPRRRRAVVPVIVAAALVVGLVAGWAIGRNSGGPGTAGSQPVASRDPAATSRLAAGDPPVDQSPTAAANAFLDSSRSADDTLPTLERSDDRIEASTSHLVATSAQGERLFAARASRGGGYCFVTSTDDHSFGETTSFVRCASAAAFTKRGVTLVSAGYTAVWSGGTVTVTVTNGQGG